MYCWLYALLLAASIQPYGPSTTALQSYKDKGLAGTLMASTVPLVGRVVTDSLEKSPVKGLADTLITSSVPLVGRVLADTLMASSVPLVGKVEADTLRAWSAALDFEIQLAVVVLHGYLHE